MKEQQFACVLLLVIIGVFVYGAQTFQQRAASQRSEADSAKEAALAAQDSFVAAKRNLDQLTVTTEGLRAYLELWEPHLRATQSAQATEQRVVDLVKQSDIFTESQRFEVLERRGDSVFASALRAHIIVKDEYVKAMNWLALLEESIPTSRLSSCVLRRAESGNDVHLSLIIDLPIAPSI
jgi:crotonobetainyl-CoA:carnitine CoA-transferase CaiB-like acyl-CoA transferase